jgi:hypothetical protein
MSRSVTSPSSRPPATTITVPIPRSFRAFAAADADSVAAMHTGGADMTSRTFLVMAHPE